MKSATLAAELLVARRLEPQQGEAARPRAVSLSSEQPETDLLVPEGSALLAAKSTVPPSEDDLAERDWAGLEQAEVEPAVAEPLRPAPSGLNEVGPASPLAEQPEVKPVAAGSQEVQHSPFEARGNLAGAVVPGA